MRRKIVARVRQDDGRVDRGKSVHCARMNPAPAPKKGLIGRPEDQDKNPVSFQSYEQPFSPTTSLKQRGPPSGEFLSNLQALAVGCS
jgi:hypothetical protein